MGMELANDDADGAVVAWIENDRITTRVIGEIPGHLLIQTPMSIGATVFQYFEEQGMPTGHGNGTDGDSAGEELGTTHVEDSEDTA